MGVYQVFCEKCRGCGEHDLNCSDRWAIPLIVNTDGRGKILSVKTEGGNVIKGQPADVFTFVCPELAAFAAGRSLRRTPDRMIFWFQPEAAKNEEVVPCAALNSSHHEPIAHSTPTRPSRPCLTPIQASTSAAPPTGDFTIGNSSIDPRSFSQMLADSQRRSSLTMKLVGSIPEFHGEARNFDPWKQKVLLAAEKCSPEEVLPFVRMCLKGKAEQHGIGPECSTLSGLLQSLQNSFDDLDTPIAAEVAFRGLIQGAQDITSHHNEVQRILRAMCETTKTKDSSIHTSYIQSLADASLRLKLLARKLRDKNMTLGDLMKLAVDSARVKNLDRIASRASNTTRSVASASFSNVDNVSVNAAVPQRPPQQSSQQGPPPKRSRFSHDENKWCEIHRSKTHDTAGCRSNQLPHCPWCKTSIPVGSLLRHKAVCSAPKCDKCQRFGHMARNCKMGAGNSSNHTQSRGYNNQQRQGRHADRSRQTPIPAPTQNPPVQAAQAQLTQMVAAAMQTDVVQSTTPATTE